MNVRTLSEIGQKITNILDVKTLIQTVYENVNVLTAADGFGIGILNGDSNKIYFEGFVENGQTLPSHSDDLEDETKLSVRCLKNGEKIIINDLKSQYQDYFGRPVVEVKFGNLPYSLVYIPLQAEGKMIGVLTVQSMKKYEYSQLELDMLDTLGAYTAIAIDNIKAYQTISNKNTQITDSIRYAQTIQKAILPIETELESYFKEYFVIFRPKDIVSGDFYWATENKTHVFVAVVDCTGHGVPGAFISMIGHAFLNEAISQRNLTDPAEILEWLHQEIRISLRQEQKVMYGGAKRPLFYALPHTDLQILRGNRRSIGGYSRKRRYTNFRSDALETPKGTMLYLFSDGYTDQSDIQGVKLGTPHLLEVLPSLASLSVSEQEQKLTHFLENHQQETPQRDDITFMGIRL